MTHARILIATMVLACFVALPSAASAAKKTQTLYGADGSGGQTSNLYELDPESGGIVRTIGPIGLSVTGLAIDPKTHELYGVTGAEDVDTPSYLIKVDKATGAATSIGDELDGTSSGAADITFTSDRTLFGWSEDSDDLVTINLSTGAATVVGESGQGTAGSGISASSSDTLFFTGENDDGALQTIDRETGLPTDVATLDGTASTRINALAFDRTDNLFGSRRLEAGAGGARDLITIDTSSGHITSVGESVDGLDALEFSEVHARCARATAHVLGTSRGDSLVGTEGGDLVSGEGGKDRLSALGGKDCVRGDGGKDTLKGGSGKDKLRAGRGNDKLRAAGGGKDDVNCGRGDDTATVDAKDKVRHCEQVHVS
jgi:Ca2+-binding RTX toxin-like protein